VSNSAYPGPGLVQDLASRGVPQAAFDGVVTSADVTRTLLRGRAGAVHHLGLASERVLFEGLPIALAPLEGADLIVCTGCPEEEFAPVLARAGERGLELICTNPDTSVTAGGRLLRFAGLVANAYRAIGGRVTETGKPGQPIYAAALDRAAELMGRMPAAERVLGIGDSLPLDVEGALARGFGALWIAGDGTRPSASSPAASAASLAW
jgi:ribonucleotide monophosphatase NagD (HAD superfamily)